MPEDKTAIIRVKLDLKTGEVLGKELIGYSAEEIHWAPLVEMLYEDIKAERKEEGA